MCYQFIILQTLTKNLKVIFDRKIHVSPNLVKILSQKEQTLKVLGNSFQKVSGGVCTNFYNAHMDEMWGNIIKNM